MKLPVLYPFLLLIGVSQAVFSQDEKNCTDCGKPMEEIEEGVYLCTNDDCPGKVKCKAVSIKSDSGEAVGGSACAAANTEAGDVSLITLAMGQLLSKRSGFVLQATALAPGAVSYSEDGVFLEDLLLLRPASERDVLRLTAGGDPGIAFRALVRILMSSPSENRTRSELLKAARTARKIVDLLKEKLGECEPEEPGNHEETEALAIPRLNQFIREFTAFSSGRRGVLLEEFIAQRGLPLGLKARAGCPGDPGEVVISIVVSELAQGNSAVILFGLNGGGTLFLNLTPVAVDGSLALVYVLNQFYGKMMLEGASIQDALVDIWQSQGKADQPAKVLAIIKDCSSATSNY